MWGADSDHTLPYVYGQCHGRVRMWCFQYHGIGMLTGVRQVN